MDDDYEGTADLGDGYFVPEVFPALISYNASGVALSYSRWDAECDGFFQENS